MGFCIGARGGGGHSRGPTHEITGALLLVRKAPEALDGLMFPMLHSGAKVPSSLSGAGLYRFRGSGISDDVSRISGAWSSKLV